MSFASSSRCCRCVASHLSVLLFLLPTQSSAGQWLIKPSVTISENYTDNVDLLPVGSEESDFVTQLNPGISVEGRGARVTLDFDYTMQNLFYENQKDLKSTYHKLDFTTTSELSQKQFFLFTKIFRTQYNDNSDNVVSVFDNLPTADSRNLTIVSVSPYFQREFYGDIAIKLRYTYNKLGLDGGAADSSIQTSNAELTSGRNRDRFKWNVTYFRQLVTREGLDDVVFSNVSGKSDYRLIESIHVFAEGAYQSDKLGVDALETNGNYLSFGLGWIPSRKIEVELIYGAEHKSASFLVRPSLHTEFLAYWKDSNVGLNSGQTVTVDASVKLRQLTWGFGYSEVATTFQQLLNTEDKDLTPVISFGPADGVFIRKRGQFTVDKKTSKTTSSLQLFRETREFIENVDQDALDRTVRGGFASFNWQFGSQTGLIAKVGGESSIAEGEENDTNLRYYSLAFERISRINITSTLRFLNSTRLDPIAGTTDNEKTIENRIEAEFNYVF